MAQPSFTIRVSKRIEIASVLLTNQQMNSISLTTIAAMKARWAQGLDVNDQPARPLSRGYSRLKLRKGRAAIADLFLTGQMQSSFVPLSAASGKATIGFNNSIAILKAYTNHKRRNQIGISDGDTRAVTPMVEQFLIDNIRSAVRSIAA